MSEANFASACHFGRSISLHFSQHYCTTVIQEHHARAIGRVLIAIVAFWQPFEASHQHFLTSSHRESRFQIPDAIRLMKLGAHFCVTATMSSADTGGEGASGAGEGGSILLNQPIVLDNGTGSIKAGFAGGSKPKVRESLAAVGARYPQA